MLQKKVCMLGSFAVGKTSLVRRFVHSVFSEKYQTTIGVKVDRKQVTMDGTDLDLMLWDIHGEDEFQNVRASYLRGSSGYLLVADGTRRETLDTVRGLHDLAVASIGKVPFLLLINKYDLQDEWGVDTAVTGEFIDNGWTVRTTSAKTSENVNECFVWLARKMLESDSPPTEEA